MSKIKLKPCPFCGRKPSKVREHYTSGNAFAFYMVECKAPMTKCFIKPKTSFCKTKEEAIEAWNTRAEQIPKEPIYSDFEEDDDDRVFPNKATCPMCGHEFEFGPWNDGESHHCVCGQRIKW